MTQVRAVNPGTGEEDRVEWLENYYCNGESGARFSNGRIYPERMLRRPKPEVKAPEMVEELVIDRGTN